MSSLPSTPSFSLNGRRAVVTGGSSGIGLASAAALAQAGATVEIVARNPEKLDKAVKILLEGTDNVSGSVLDVTDTRKLREFFRDREPFDVAVISAGIARHSPAWEATEENYDAVTDVNTRAAYFTAVEASRKMRGRGGSIIQISSQMGFVGGQDRTVYCASKHALEGMTKAMAIEWGGDGIRVNTICPTFIRTELSEVTLKDPEKKAWILSKIKLSRIGELEDVMGAVVFLASDASAMVTGTHILIDGGWTAG